MKKLIRENRQRINRDLQDPEKRKYFSPSSYAAHEITMPEILKYAHGKLIDIGCGDMPYKGVLVNKVELYDSIDIERRAPDVKYLGDVHNMDVLASDSYDTAICLEVLEHIRDPFKALGEICRVLKKNGILILSVPHLSRLHEEPHDYFRYTKYGLQSSVEGAGFKVLSVTPGGGLLCFLGHQFSTVLLGLVWQIPVIRQIFFFLKQMAVRQIMLFSGQYFR